MWAERPPTVSGVGESVKEGVEVDMVEKVLLVCGYESSVGQLAAGHSACGDTDLPVVGQAAVIGSRIRCRGWLWPGLPEMNACPFTQSVLHPNNRLNRHTSNHTHQHNKKNPASRSTCRF